MAKYTVVLRTPEQVAEYKKDKELILRIAERAQRELALSKDSNKVLAKAILGCHLLCCQLKLQELLDYDSNNFAHDIVGIMNHVDEHYQLQNCFLPRCAKEQ